MRRAPGPLVVARLAIAVAVLAFTALHAAAPPTAAPRIGILAHDLPPGLLDDFRDELQRLGHVEGKTIPPSVLVLANRVIE